MITLLVHYRQLQFIDDDVMKALLARQVNQVPCIVSLILCIIGELGARVS
jgi:hypothetical protein